MGSGSWKLQGNAPAHSRLLATTLQGKGLLQPTLFAPAFCNPHGAVVTMQEEDLMEPEPHYEDFRSLRRKIFEWEGELYAGLTAAA